MAYRPTKNDYSPNEPPRRQGRQEKKERKEIKEKKAIPEST
jgi:hypothetical protein